MATVTLNNSFAILSADMKSSTGIAIKRIVSILTFFYYWTYKPEIWHAYVKLKFLNLFTPVKFLA